MQRAREGVLACRDGDRHDSVNGSSVVDVGFIKCPFDGEDKVSC